MTTNFDVPFQAPIADKDGAVTLAWRALLTRWQAAVQSLYQSGPTADRPTSGLWIGRQFYDTTLNQPVYVSAVKPTVWRDAAGGIV